MEVDCLTAAVPDSPDADPGRHCDWLELPPVVGVDLAARSLPGRVHVSAR